MSECNKSDKLQSSFQFVEIPLHLHQLSVAPFFNDPSLLQHYYLIRVPHCADSVGDIYRSFVGHNPIQRILHSSLVDAVEGGSALVQQENLGSSQNDASNCHSLFLSARNMRALHSYVLIESASVLLY
jgi:hypothetical protein